MSRLYWVVKGKRGLTAWNKWLKSGGTRFTRTTRPPAEWNRGDRIFWWKSSPGLRLAGVGELIRIPDHPNPAGEYKVRVQVTAPEFADQLGIDELRLVPLLDANCFLHPGRSATFYRLSEPQAALLYQLIAAANPRMPYWSEFDRTSRISAKWWNAIARARRSAARAA